MNSHPTERVSRRRYEREKRARAEAEALLEAKSRELFLANQKLSEQSSILEQTVQERTAELRLALEKAEAASTARSRFIATMSHEIRTPLGGLLGMIDLLAMDETDPGKQELFDFAKTAGAGLNRIVNDVLDFSKMDAGVFVFEEESVDIRALVESIRMLSANQNGFQRDILIKIDPSVPHRFLGDATRIRQVISNLVSNGLRYSTDGPIIVRASAKSHEKGAMLHVEVEDFGVGIAEDKLSDLFKDFSQVQNPLTAAAQGVGLGLAICKRILNECGGTIGVNSSLGVGSTFWFDLPVEVIGDATEMATSVNDDGHSGEAIGLQGKRVLIAEDNVINQKLLMTYAERMNLRPDLAENGRIALEKFEPGKYDLVLMDVAMPEMDGLEATKRIRETWQNANIPPIMALTAHVMDAIEEEATLAGLDYVLSKPIPFEELKLALEDALNQDRKPKPLDTSEPAKPVPAVDRHSALLARMSPDVVQEMLEFFSADDLAKFVVKFITDAGGRLEKLSNAYDTGDITEVSAQAHSIKGAALVLGFSEIADWAKAIEKGETAELGQTIPETAGKIKRTLQELEALL